MRTLYVSCMVIGMIATTSTSTARGSELKLTADWNGMKSRQSCPVTSGVPFARGAFTDPSQVRLLANGKSLPLQTEVMAWWPDGSVKWMLLDFQARPGTTDLVLRYGPGVKPVPQGSGIEASQRKGAVTIDTGVVKFTVQPKGSGFIDRLSFRGKKVFDSTGKRLNFMDCLHTDDPADYRPMDRYIADGKMDPSKLVITGVALEKKGPLHASVIIDGKYTYKLVGTTIKGTDVKGDCPFRIRIHAYAGKSFLKVEHFFYYEGDGDHDFTKSLALKVPLPTGTGNIRYIDGKANVVEAPGPMAGLYQQSADHYHVWNSEGTSAGILVEGRRFEGVLDVTGAEVGIAVGVKDFWQNHAKSLHADLTSGELGVYLWPPEAPPLDYRRHARDWSVGESYAPRRRGPGSAIPFDRRSFPNYRLASKGVGKTHYAMVNFHDPAAKCEDILEPQSLLNHRPMVWAPAKHYADSLVLGRYRHRIAGQHQDIEAALDKPLSFWRFSQERFRWYGMWIYGQVCQDFNNYQQNGRWVRDYGRWGWSCGDSVGRLAYALMLQAVRTRRRSNLEFAEKYLYSVHDVCSTHSEAYPHHFRSKFIYIKGASHRHGAWPWAGPYCGARGSHPVGAKIYYFLTGEGHAKDILEEMTQLAIKNPHGGEGDGPLGINAQSFLYKWESTGQDIWKKRLEAEIEGSKDLKTAESGWMVMMSAAFGIYNALEEYMDLTGDYSHAPLAADFADRAMPGKMRTSWTWPDGYFRVYGVAYNLTGDQKYLDALQTTLPIFVGKVNSSAAGKTEAKNWPGPTGGPRSYTDGNVIRDIPFALYSLHSKPIITRSEKDK